MNLLSGLEKFGLDKMDTNQIFKEEKSEKKEKEQEQPQPKAAEKKEPLHKEVEFLLDKSIHCPVCDTVFKTRVVKNGRVKRMEPDFDLRPRFQYIDTNKYDVSSCPNCGYTAMNRYFEHLSKGQIKMIQEAVCQKFNNQGRLKEEPMEPYSYERAIERYKLALYNTMAKKGKTSEKAYECLKISWLYRGWMEELDGADTTDEALLADCEKEEMLYYEQAYEGMIKAIASENFPICGMDESTVNILMANMANRLGKVDIASRFISMILTSPAASRVAKDRALDLKEQIIAKLHGKG